MDRRTPAIAALLLLAASLAGAQESVREIGVFSRLAESDADLGLGVHVGVDVGRGTRLEAVLDVRHDDFFVFQYGAWPDPYRSGGANIETLQIGVARYWGGPSFFPFVVGAAGVSVASPEFGPFEHKGYLTASAGGGFEATLGKAWFFRLDGRIEWVDWEEERDSGDYLLTWKADHQGVLRLGIGARW